MNAWRPDTRPLTWVRMVGPLRLVVTKDHRLFPRKWIMGCEPFFWNEKMSLSYESPPEMAQQIADNWLKAKLQVALRDLGGSS